MKRKRPIDTFRMDWTPLRQTRMVHDVSVKQLAEWAGMSTFTVYRIEKNHAEPTFRQVVSWARAMGVPIHSLCNVEPL